MFENIKNIINNLKTQCPAANLFLITSILWGIFGLSLGCFYGRSIPGLAIFYAIIWVIFWLSIIWLLCAEISVWLGYILSIICTLALMFFTMSIMFNLMGDAFTDGVIKRLEGTTITGNIYRT